MSAPPENEEAGASTRADRGPASERALHSNSTATLAEPTASPQGELKFRVPKFQPQAKWRQRHPLARWCHVATASALKQGLIRREPCEVCGEVAEAHHADHRQPLQIQWFCRKHHKEAETRLKAEEVRP
jgi:hypothetical protein